jgi:hypothetical protein
VGMGLCDARSSCSCPRLVAHSKRSLQRVLVPPARASTRDGDAVESKDKIAINTALLVATAVSIANPVPSASARQEEFSECPSARRHHRRLETQSRVDKMILRNDRRRKKKREIQRTRELQAGQEQLDKALKEAKLKDDVLLQSVESIKQVIATNMQKETPKYSVSVRGRPAPSSYFGHSIRQRDSPLPAGVGILWGLVGVSVFWYLKNKFGWSLGWAGKNKGEAGRWVRDRSLGGRMVFLEDSKKAAVPRPLWEDLPGEEEAKKKKTLPGYLSDDEKATVPLESTKKVVPVWWAPPQPVKYVSKDRRADLQKQADMIVRRLQNEKIELGQDYSLRGLVDLRQTCNSGGGLTVTTSTQSGRDSMLRMAVKHSLENPKSALGGYEPGRFVSGLATDLGVPDERAVTIVHAEIASTCRNALIDAEAAFRSQDERLVSKSLSKILHALQSFPIPSQSAEMEMVGRSVMRTTSLEFRKAVFFSAGAVDLSIAPVIAEMLGFQSELVMPQLVAQLQVMGNENASSTQET